MPNYSCIFSNMLYVLIASIFKDKVGLTAVAKWLKDGICARIIPSSPWEYLSRRGHPLPQSLSLAPCTTS